MLKARATITEKIHVQIALVDICLRQERRDLEGAASVVNIVDNS
jgi:hypothetical protein